MLKIVVSSAISALAVFAIMSFGASGQTPRPTATPRAVESVITSTAVYSDAETIILEVRDDLRKIFDVLELEESAIVTGTYSTDIESSNISYDLKRVPPDLRPLIVAKVAATRFCIGYFRSLEGEENDGFSYGMIVFPIFLKCNDDIATATIALFEKASDYGIDIVIE